MEQEEEGYACLPVHKSSCVVSKSVLSVTSPDCVGLLQEGPAVGHK